MSSIFSRIKSIQHIGEKTDGVIQFKEVRSREIMEDSINSSKPLNIILGLTWSYWKRFKRKETHKVSNFIYLKG